MGTFTVKFTFTKNDNCVLDYLIDWYVQRGMDCTAGVGGDGTGSADIDKKYLAAFCAIETINVTSVKWDKHGITAWRPKRKTIRRASSRRTHQAISANRATTSARKQQPGMTHKRNGHTV